MNPRAAAARRGARADPSQKPQGHHRPSREVPGQPPEGERRKRMKTEEIERCIGRVGVINAAGHNVAALAHTELAALKSTAEDLECLLGEAQVDNERLREALREAFAWIKNWDAAFIEDGEWPATEEKIVAALARE